MDGRMDKYAGRVIVCFSCTITGEHIVTGVYEFPVSQVCYNFIVLGTTSDTRQSFGGL